MTSCQQNFNGPITAQYKNYMDQGDVWIKGMYILTSHGHEGAVLEGGCSGQSVCGPTWVLCD